METPIDVDNRRLSLMVMLNIYPIKRTLFSMLRPSTISSMYAALCISIPVEDRKRYMKLEREVFRNTRELYDFISYGYKVFMVGSEIDKIKQRIEDPNNFYRQSISSKHILDKVWIVVIRNNINKTIDNVYNGIRQLEPLNVNWHRRDCCLFNSICRCKNINDTEFDHYLSDMDNVWYSYNDSKENNTILYYHPGKNYVSSTVLLDHYRPYIRLLNYGSTSFLGRDFNSSSKIQYIDIEDNNECIQYPKPTPSMDKTYTELQIYIFSLYDKPKMLYI